MSPKDYMDKQPALVREYMLGQLALISFGWGFLPCQRYQWGDQSKTHMQIAETEARP